MISYIYKADNVHTTITLTHVDDVYRVTEYYKNPVYRSISNSFETNDFEFAKAKFFEHCKTHNMINLIRKF
ncbi:MAG: hypothetical protein J6Y20_05895 [Lachnospiraceae bacterium]|nr:hypothetical protein [Lachnospiraceae bacterium]